MEYLSLTEMENIDGGRLKSVSDWMLLGSGVCFCFCSPVVAVPATIAIAIFS